LAESVASQAVRLACSQEESLTNNRLMPKIHFGSPADRHQDDKRNLLQKHLALPPNTACTRPPIRRKFQSYFRVGIVVWGASVLRRSLGGG